MENSGADSNLSRGPTLTMNFEGVYTAIITPFQNGGRDIDFGAYRELVERQVAAGVAGIVPCGTTGESPTLTHTEHTELIRRTVELVAGRVQVVAGTGSNSTAEAIALTRQAASDGVDAVMLVNPYYNKPPQEGLFQHFRAVAEIARVPVVIYNIKSRTGVNVRVETFQRLLEIPNVQAVKEASGDLQQMAQIQRSCGHRLALLSGDDNITPAVMGIGGRGVISVASNIYPFRMTRMLRCYLAGDFTKGNEIFYQLLDFMNALFWEPNPIPVKAAAEIRGLASRAVRLPLVELSAARREKLAAIMEAAGADQ